MNRKYVIKWLKRHEIKKKKIKIQAQNLYYLNSQHSWFLSEVVWWIKNMAPNSFTCSQKKLGSKSLPIESRQPMKAPPLPWWCWVTSKVKTEKIMQLPPGLLETLAPGEASLHVRSPLPWDYLAVKATCRHFCTQPQLSILTKASQHQLTAKWASWHLTTTAWEAPSVNWPAEPFPNSWPTCHDQKKKKKWLS